MPVAQKLYRSEDNIYLIFLENYFIWKLFAAVTETFSNAYPDNKLLKTTTIHRLVTFWGAGIVCGEECV
jgi:hypothetical protein